MKPLLITSSTTSSTNTMLQILPHQPYTNFSKLPKSTLEKGQEKTQKKTAQQKSKMQTLNSTQCSSSMVLKEESISYSHPETSHQIISTNNQQEAAPTIHSMDLTKNRRVVAKSTKTILASVTPNINKQKATKTTSSITLVSPTRTLSATTINNFTQDSQPVSNNNTMPFTTVVTNATNRKKNVLMSDSPSSSTSSLNSSSSSSSNFGQQVEILVTMDSPPSPQVTSVQKNSVRKTIKEYYKIEGLLEKNDEGLQLLRAYLSERRNDEMLIYLESNREFRLMRKNYANDVNMSRITLVREFKTIYENFVNFESLTCMNIASSIRESFTQTLKEVQVLSQDEIPNQTLCERMEKCLDTLLFNIQLQFNNEIMTHFKKSSEFKTFVITKLIELSASETSSIMEDMEKTSPRTPGEHLISNILVDNEMEEYSKTFTKKKLVTLDQIRHFTADDYRDKIGMKKIGHLKRIVRVVNEHFNKQSGSTC
ncbi:hypothetical protein NAEGRDRAFT_80384 [Naegleria gruberi]|uniref:SAM domain-containing protein n=1 Tax=Naegleria gruberi TaxID=5762 RepID=D2VKX7_NAEGR|nr:uncharacterized protein NAEGRDRAFT_80384 [Naegleria gruberi]EFC42519.1 hypothetical protein NAEGRDRAFT_80384 [Naegleria gruberi]|eukprot:XP_002675263.1 hypothetical protein NAEGRDRAFT_80384 [Naegleria gruberi strain NEG-M]